MSKTACFCENCRILFGKGCVHNSSSLSFWNLFDRFGIKMNVCMFQKLQVEEILFLDATFSAFLSMHKSTLCYFFKYVCQSQIKY